MGASSKKRPGANDPAVSSGQSELMLQARSSAHRSGSLGPAKKLSYSAPSDIQETTLGQLLNGRRLLQRQSQPSLMEPEPSADARRSLWVSGDVTLTQRPCVAIVGTREASEDGRRRARRLAHELVARGVVIVSGLARGIDTDALLEAIAAGGRVIGVIGTPIHRAYPNENALLQEEIAARHLLVSPFAPSTRTLPRHFPERNKVMAALTDATAIIEAGETSGTLHQAAECIRLDRWLFIARNVVENPELTWPAKFRKYPNTRTLSQPEDIVDVLETRPRA